MSLIILEGLDRTGKSSVAEYFSSKGYEVIHMSAPKKGTTQDEFLQEMVDIITAAATKDICLDRSYYGELVWPQIYNRPSLLSEENLEILREVEATVDTKHILMYDNNVEAHWQRCVDNKEPLTKAQFSRARSLYSQMASKYNFELVTLPIFLNEYPEAKTMTATITNNSTVIVEDLVKPVQSADTAHIKYPPSKTPEQMKLEQANVINEILSKRILKQKGQLYDSLENDVRYFLNTKLAQLLGTTSQEQEISLTREEIIFYKTMFKKAMKENR